MCETPLPRLLGEFIEKNHKGGEFIPMDDFREMCKKVHDVPPAVCLAAYIHQFQVLRETIPSHIAIPLLEEKIREINNEFENIYKYKGILLDGFPREFDHFTAAETIRSCTKLVIFLECPLDVARSRFLRRANSTDDGAAYEQRLWKLLESQSYLIPELDQRELLLTFTNDGSMTIDQAYETLVEKLSSNEKWRSIVGSTHLPLF
ncbi:hypothetical protein F4818DRAFT_433686 [Hypoxylon cercidicola]|nr:hypothetical protein F4818DRAFT_433686 [Hypoxylon cercidicola]